MFDRGISSQDKHKRKFKSIQKQSTCCWQIRGPPASQYARAQWQWLSKDKGTQAPERRGLVLDRRTHVLDADKHLRTRTLDLDWSSQVGIWYCDQFTTTKGWNNSVVEVNNQLWCEFRSFGLWWLWFCFFWGIRCILVLDVYWLWYGYEYGYDCGLWPLGHSIECSIAPTSQFQH